MLKDGVTPDLRHVEMTIQKYQASEGLEMFVAVEDLKNDVLIGYLRLRIPSTNALLQDVALVRELHIYGPLVPVGERRKDSWQHRGYGRTLLKTAEKIAKEEFAKNRILVTSALGARNYFRRLGYTLQNPYMMKTLSN